MWIINTVPLTILSNDPDHNISGLLIEANPGMAIFKSEKKGDYNLFSALVDATKEVQGEPTTEMVPGQEVDPATQEAILVEAAVPGPVTIEPVGNTFELQSESLVVFDPEGAELARFALEVVFDPSAE